MGSCCVKKPDNNKVQRYHNRGHYQNVQQKAQQKDDHIYAMYLQQQEHLANQNNHNNQEYQYVDSNKIMKNNANGRVIGGNDAYADQYIDEDERRRKIAEAAEQRQNKNKNRGISQQGAIEMQFKERQLQEAEKYNNRYDEYNLKWRND